MVVVEGLRRMRRRKRERESKRRTQTFSMGRRCAREAVRVVTNTSTRRAPSVCTRTLTLARTHHMQRFWDPSSEAGARKAHTLTRRAPTLSPHNPYPPRARPHVGSPAMFIFNPRTCTAHAVRSPRAGRGGATTCVAAPFYLSLRNPRKGIRRGKGEESTSTYKPERILEESKAAFSSPPLTPQGRQKPCPPAASPSPTLTTAPPRRRGGSPASPGRRRPQSCRSRPPGCRRCRARSPAAGRCASPPRRPGRGSPTSAR